MWDRIIRSIFGILFTIWAIIGGPWWTWVGVYLIASAAWGYCIVYSMIKFRTAKNEVAAVSAPEIRES